MKIIASLALATLLTGCATLPDDECLLCSGSASRAPAPDVQIATGAVAHAGQHTSAKLR